MDKERQNIVVLDGYTLNPGDLSWRGIEELGELKVYDRTEPRLVVKRSKEAFAILTNKVVIDANIMSRLLRLKYIGVMATGYNVVDVVAARERGITVTNVPAYSTDSVVQMTFAHILNITNRIGHYAHENRRRRWAESPDFTYWDTPLMELSGKTLGIVGLGNIGMGVARTAMCFGMDVKALTSKPSESLPQGIRKASLPDLMATSDIVSLHCPLTPETYHIVNAATLSLMKPGAILINTGRGPLVDEEAVADALHEGRLGAYGADVMAQEPPRADNPLLHAPNAYLTPHIAWATIEARRRLMATLASNLRAFINGQPQNVVGADIP